VPEITFEDVIGCLGKVNELQSDMVGISIGIKTNEGPSEVFKDAIDWASPRKWSETWLVFKYTTTNKTKY